MIDCVPQVNEQLFEAAWWCFKSKETNSTVFLPNILPWISLLHFQKLVCFVEDRNVAIIVF